MIPAGYDSSVCSIMESSIDGVTAAIDQLATDVQGKACGQEITARVADLWRMMGTLDPEVARRAQRYTAPVGSTPAD